MDEFSLCFARLRELDIQVKDSGWSKEELSAKPLDEIVDLLEIRDPNKLFFKSISQQEFRLLLDRTQEALAALDGAEIEDRLRRVTEEIRREKSFPKQLVFVKIFEEVAMFSGNENLWRKIMGDFFSPILNIKMPTRITGGKLELLSSSSLATIYESGLAVPDRQMLAASIVANSLFHPDKRRNLYTLDAMRRIQDPLAFAAMAAFVHQSHNDIGVVTRALESLAAHAKSMGKVGTTHSGTKLKKVDDNWVSRQILDGLQRMLDIGNVRLPHPLFLPRAGERGFPIPTFDDEGMHVVAIDALSKVRSSIGLSLLLEHGLVHLMVPHMRIDKAGVEGERTVLRARALFARALEKSFDINRVGAGEEFTRVILGYPEPLQIWEIGEQSKRELAPAFYRLARRAGFLNVGDLPIPSIARTGLREVLLSGTDKLHGRELEKRLDRNLQVFLNRHGTVFREETERERLHKGIDEGEQRMRYARFLAKVIGEKRLRATLQIPEKRLLMPRRVG